MSMFFFCTIRAAKIENFESLKFKANGGKHCDVVVDTPTYIMELDSSEFYFSFNSVVYTFLRDLMGVKIHYMK